MQKNFDGRLETNFFCSEKVNQWDKHGIFMVFLMLGKSQASLYIANHDAISNSCFRVKFGCVENLRQYS